MGSLLGSTVVIAADRGKLTTQQLMRRISQSVGEQSVVLSVIGCTELLQGLYIDRDPVRYSRRELFFSE